MRFAILLFMLLSFSLRAESLSNVPLSALDLSLMSSGWGNPQVDKSISGARLSIGGIIYTNGVGTHAPSVLHIALNKGAARFTALVGVDDDVGGSPIASVEFKVYTKKMLAFDSGVMRAGDAAKKVDVDLAGAEKLVLVVSCAEDFFGYDHADWAMAKFEGVTGKPVAVEPPVEPECILTPEAGPQPQINGPLVFGARPGNPFVYRIPATGERPMTFSAENLPASMVLDSATGIITGTSPRERGEYTITFHAENARGKDSRAFKLVVGNILALTPPMGWNNWYACYHQVSDKFIRNAADAMISSGMADFGYMYVNIDDGWSKKEGAPPYRDGHGAILPNDKFPDMGALTAYIHSKGLRAGLHSSPGPWNCSGYVGDYEHEQVDAEKFAEWGFDFLKYDYCSYQSIARDGSRLELMKPYVLMGGYLEMARRDIVFNLCQYGVGDVWKWGAATGGQSWRTTGDLGQILSTRRSYLGYLEVAFINARLHEYAGPGRWNDPDYIMIGQLVDVDSDGSGPLIKTCLTPNQQYQYMSLWSLMDAPLIYSGDITHLDKFTRNVLCNREIIAVNQDPLGRQAALVERSGEHLILAKDMADGSKVVGIFNTSEIKLDLKVIWKALGLTGSAKVRDLWRQKELGKFDREFSVTLPRYGVSVIRIAP